MFPLTHDLVLGSKSPRRASLLQALGFAFDVRVTEADERAPAGLSAEETAVYVSAQKAKALQPLLASNELGLTSDTEVWLDEHRFGKPANAQEAEEMLQRLSGRTHRVVTALTLVTTKELHHALSVVEVTFKRLPQWAINHYIAQYKPFDKAGGYGIQEWIGMAFISEIKGEYNSVVGLPTATLIEALEPFRAY